MFPMPVRFSWAWNDSGSFKKQAQICHVKWICHVFMCQAMWLQWEMFTVIGLMPEWNCPGPTPNSLGFLEYLRASKSTKINHMCSNHKHKTRFQDIVYLKLNKWRAKILKNINKKNSTWCVKLMRKQEIIISLLHDKMSHRSWENWLYEN